MSGQYYGFMSVQNYWDISPAETALRIGAIVAENAEYFCQFEAAADFHRAVKRAVVDRKMWHPGERRWVPIELAGSLN